MSFILDALKKSESDRQQQSNAEFSSVPSSPGAAAVPAWLWLVGFLLIITIAVLAGLLLKPDSDSNQSTSSPGRVTVELSKTGTAAASSFAEQVAIAQRSAPQQQIEDATAGAGETPAGTVRPTIISQNPSAVLATDIYPSVIEVRAAGKSNLPELHLDIHVYSSDPKDRFVFINMAKLREGSRLAEGPVVAEITPDGVVLGHQGQYFLLPRD